MLCKECNNTAECVWCQGTGRGRINGVCDRCRGSGTCFSCGGQKLDANLLERLLIDLCQSFKNKIGDDYQLLAQFTVMDLDQTWIVAIQRGKKIVVKKGEHAKAWYFFTTDSETLRKIYAGEMTAMTAAGKGGAEAPVMDVRVAKGLDPNQARRQVFAFLQQFFNRTVPEKIVLAEKHARKIQGAYAIPLYNSSAQRSAWCLLKNGDRLNDHGQPNPFPQSFVFIEGEGFATIGAETVKVKAGESYFVPPNCGHVVWNEKKEPLVLISLAWNEGD